MVNPLCGTWRNNTLKAKGKGARCRCQRVKAKKSRFFGGNLRRSEQRLAADNPRRSLRECETHALNPHTASVITMAGYLASIDPRGLDRADRELNGRFPAATCARRDTVGKL
jgi:hypothetical protein